MKFINWLVTSSADPDAFSLTLKGLLTVGASYVLNIATIACTMHVYCLPITETWLTAAIAATVAIVHAVLLAIGAGVTLYGLIRKAAIGQWSAAQ